MTRLAQNESFAELLEKVLQPANSTKRAQTTVFIDFLAPITMGTTARSKFRGLPARIPFPIRKIGGGCQPCGMPHPRRPTAITVETSAKKYRFVVIGRDAGVLVSAQLPRQPSSNSTLAPSSACTLAHEAGHRRTLVGLAGLS
ncbi:MAG: hypothetical protein BWY17_01637 [Deltaproteobacteria bacterium ADurb.Bin207]|nr:MAG: hypothetical protein BWY17_01637 [Deltaproteobacteria bacterium ADurb.Bin207]